MRLGRQKRVGSRTVTEPPAWGTPEAVAPDTSVEDAPASLEPGRFYPARTPKGTRLTDLPRRWEVERESFQQQRDRMAQLLDLTPGDRMARDLARLEGHVDALLAEVRQTASGRARVDRGVRSYYEVRRQQRLLDRIGRARYPEGLSYRPIGPFAPGGAMDLTAPTIEELRPVNHYPTEDAESQQYEDLDLASYAEVSGGLVEALRNCDRPAPRDGRVGPRTRAALEDATHEHTWIDERELASTWVRRFCPGCGANESYDDRPEPLDLDRARHHAECGCLDCSPGY